MLCVVREISSCPGFNSALLSDPDRVSIWFFVFLKSDLDLDKLCSLGWPMRIFALLLENPTPSIVSFYRLAVDMPL